MAYWDGEALGKCNSKTGQRWVTSQYFFLSRSVFTLLTPFQWTVWVPLIIMLLIGPLLLVLVAYGEAFIGSKYKFWTNISNCVWYCFTTFFGENIDSPTDKMWGLRYFSKPFLKHI